MLPDISVLRELESHFFGQFGQFAELSQSGSDLNPNSDFPESNFLESERKVVRVEIVGFRSFLKSTGKK